MAKVATMIRDDVAEAAVALRAAQDRLNTVMRELQSADPVVRAEARLEEAEARRAILMAEAAVARARKGRDEVRAKEQAERQAQAEQAYKQALREVVVALRPALKTFAAAVALWDEETGRGVRLPPPGILPATEEVLEQWERSHGL